MINRSTFNFTIVLFFCLALAACNNNKERLQGKWRFFRENYPEQGISWIWNVKGDTLYRKTGYYLDTFLVDLHGDSIQQNWDYASYDHFSWRGKDTLDMAHGIIGVRIDTSRWTIHDELFGHLMLEVKLPKSTCISLNSANIIEVLKSSWLSTVYLGRTPKNVMVYGHLPPFIFQCNDLIVKKEDLQRFFSVECTNNQNQILLYVDKNTSLRYYYEFLEELTKANIRKFYLGYLNESVTKEQVDYVRIENYNYNVPPPNNVLEQISDKCSWYMSDSNTVHVVEKGDTTILNFPRLKEWLKQRDVKKTLIEFSGQKEVEFEHYLQMHQVVREHCSTQRNLLAKQRFSKPYDQLNKEQKGNINAELPFICFDSLNKFNAFNNAR